MGTIVRAPAGAVPMDVVVNFSDGSGTLTAAKMNNGTHGANWGTWEEYHEQAQGSPNQYSVIENHNVRLPFKIFCAGALYDGSEGQGMTFDFSSEPTEDDVWHMSIGDITFAQALLLINYATIAGAASYHNDTLMFASGNYTVPQMQFGGDRQVKCHSEGSLGGGIAYISGWVIVGVKHDVGAGVGECYLQDVASGAILGGSRSNNTTLFPDLVYIRLQSYLRGINQGGGSHKIKLLALRNSDMTWPAYPITVPTPSAVRATQTGAGEVTFAWTSTCNAFRVERNLNGAGWSVLNADLITNDFTFVDSTVVTTDTVLYRVTAKIGSQVSPTVTSNTVVVS